MMKVAITGTMCSGKSFVCNLLREKNYKIFSSDQFFKELVSNDSETKEYIRGLFPEAARGGVVDRKVLAEQSLKCPEKFSEYEKFIHQKIKMKRADVFKKYKNEEFVFFEVPLLFEKKLENEFDKIILVTANEKILKNRIEERKTPGNKTYIEKLINKQIPNSHKKEKSDFVIDTSGDETIVIKQINDIINSL